MENIVDGRPDVVTGSFVIISMCQSCAVVVKYSAAQYFRSHTRHVDYYCRDACVCRLSRPICDWARVGSNICF
jgi:hypothetical protein